MPGATLRTKGDYHRGLERIDDRRESRSQLAEHFERCESAVGKTEQVKLSHAEPFGRAIRLLGPGGGELRSGGDVGEIANALGAVGGDDEMRLAPLSGELRQQWADDAFIVWVSEYCEDGPAVLSPRRVRDDRGEPHEQEGMYGNAHPIHCILTRLRARPRTRVRTGGWVSLRPGGWVSPGWGFHEV